MTFSAWKLVERGSSHTAFAQKSLPRVLAWLQVWSYKECIHRGRVAGLREGSPALDTNDIVSEGNSRGSISQLTHTAGSRKAS
jgi:hypothetical protein